MIFTGSPRARRGIYKFLIIATIEDSNRHPFQHSSFETFTAILVNRPSLNVHFMSFARS